MKKKTGYFSSVTVTYPGVGLLEIIPSTISHLPVSSKAEKCVKETLRKKCPNTKFFWSVFNQNRENPDQKNSVFKHFSRSENLRV